MSIEQTSRSAAANNQGAAAGAGGGVVSGFGGGSHLICGAARERREDPAAHAAGYMTSITEVGRRMLRFPVHPRYARMLLAAQERGCVRAGGVDGGADAGAEFFAARSGQAHGGGAGGHAGEEHESDFFLLMRAWRYADRVIFCWRRAGAWEFHAQGARQVGPLFEQFLEIAAKEGLDVAERRADDAELRKCALAGFSDQLGWRLDGGTLRRELVHGRRGLRFDFEKR